VTTAEIAALAAASSASSVGLTRRA